MIVEHCRVKNIIFNYVFFKKVNHQTPLMDLSQIYGTNNSLAQSLRSFQNGFLKMEYRNKRLFPSTPVRNDFCVANKKGWPCFELGRYFLLLLLVLVTQFEFI